MRLKRNGRNGKEVGVVRIRTKCNLSLYDTMKRKGMAKNKDFRRIFLSPSCHPKSENKGNLKQFETTSRIVNFGSGTGKNWSGKRDSNPRPSPWQGDALPLSYSRNNGGEDKIAIIRYIVKEKIQTAT